MDAAARKCYEELFGSDDDDDDRPDLVVDDFQANDEEDNHDDDNPEDTNQEDKDAQDEYRRVADQLRQNLEAHESAPRWDRDTIDVWHNTTYLEETFDARIVQDLEKQRTFDRFDINNNVFYDCDRQDYVSTGKRTANVVERLRVETFLNVEWQGFKAGQAFPRETACLCRTCLGAIRASPSNPRGLPLGLPVSQRLNRQPKGSVDNTSKLFMPRQCADGNRFNCLPVFCSPACVRTFNSMYLGGVDKERRWMWFRRVAKYLGIDDRYLTEHGNWGPPRELNELVTRQRSGDLDALVHTEQQLQLRPQNVRYEFLPVMYVSQERVMRSCTYESTRQKIQVLRDKLQLNTDINETFEIRTSELAANPVSVNTNVALPTSVVNKKRKAVTRNRSNKK